ncbi:MAG: AEC family transporter [Clostridia bacterium]|nr:AEC family transporter [Clostridia bacterium]
MLDNFLYSANTVLPIFVMVALGYFLKRIKFLDTSFFSQAEKYVFKIALPCMLFLEIARAGGTAEFDLKLVIFCCVSITLLVLLLCLIVPRIVRGRDKCGAIIQGIYRSNFAVLGVPLATNMFGEVGGSAIAVVMPFVIVLFNVYAVLILSLFAPQEARLSPKQLAGKTLRTIVTNPLIIAVVLAMPFLLFDWTMPTLLEKSTNYLSNTVFALSLMSLGSTITWQSMQGKLRYSLTAALIKMVGLPIIFLSVGVLLGFRGIDLGIIFILCGTPSAVSSYIMAKNMKSDHELAGQILLLTTLLCIFTFFSGVFFLKTMSLI